MMDDLLTPQQFAAKIKAKYPEYADVDDVTLSKKIVEKYPEYADRVQLDSSLKRVSAGPSVEPVEQFYGEDILAYTGAVPFKRPEMAEVEDSGLKLYDEKLSPLENVKLAVYDINNQFNRTLLNTVGAPIDLI
jgi:hypothetical protein